MPRSSVSSVHPAARGDSPDTAIERSFREHHQVLVRFAMHFLQSRDEAEEVVQELFLALWERRDRDEPIDLSRAYLFAAVRHRALNVLRHERVVRRHGARALLDPPPASPSALDEVAGDELAARVRAALAGLSPKCRQVFLLSREGGLTYGEIAQTLGVHQKTVELHMTRALRALRAVLSVITPVLVLARQGGFEELLRR